MNLMIFHFHLRMVLLLVLNQSPLGHKSFPTELTGKVLFACVFSHVDLEVESLSEHFATHLAGLETLDALPFLRPHYSSTAGDVFPELLVLLAEGESLATLWAHRLLQLVMNFVQVLLQAVTTGQRLATEFTEILRHRHSSHQLVILRHVDLQILPGLEHLLADLALGGLVFDEHVVVQSVPLGEQFTTVGTRQIYLQGFVNISGVSVEIILGFEGRVANVANKVPLRVVSLQVTVEPPVAEKFVTDWTDRSVAGVSVLLVQ